MIILSIESTCDETGIALIEAKDNKIKIIHNELASQIKIHQKYGGVVPILAAREHKKNLPFLLKKIEKGFNLNNIDYIAFSVGPGLLPALVSGKEFVQNLAKKLNKKIIPVDHLMAHFYSALIEKKSNWQKIKDLQFPALVLVVSGGHTNLYLFKNFQEKRMLGQTLDDAAGEVFDKCARYLNLPYPGGPEIEERAKHSKGYFSLPKPILKQGYNFSFSGLKTAFIEIVDEIKTYKKLDDQTINDLCFSLQKTIFEILIFKLQKAKENFKIKDIVVTGGVAANQTLRDMTKKFFPNTKILFPERKLSTDNGLNIALAGYLLFKNGTEPLEPEKIEVYPRSN
jgi:N6-L-threonylcarbamoyladenine synthase